jgi:sec-independent protein translocase protein TatB
MFDFGVGYSELFVLALIAVIFIGPKDLPKVLRVIGQFMRKARGMAGEFQTHVDAAMKESGFDELKKEAQGLKSSFAAPTNLMMGAAASQSPKGNDFDAVFGAGAEAGETKVAGAAVAGQPAAAK